MPREVRIFERQFLALTACHCKIQIWPETTEKVGVGDFESNKVTSVSGKWHVSKVFRVFLRAGSKLEPASRWVVLGIQQLIKTTKRTFSMRQCWFVSSRRKNLIQTSPFPFYAEHFIDDYFACSSQSWWRLDETLCQRSAIRSTGKKNAMGDRFLSRSFRDHRIVSAVSINLCCKYTKIYSLYFASPFTPFLQC